jgi:hypothetical protein
VVDRFDYVLNGQKHGDIGTSGVLALGNSKLELSSSAFSASFLYRRITLRTVL